MTDLARIRRGPFYLPCAAFSPDLSLCVTVSEGTAVAVATASGQEIARIRGAYPIVAVTIENESVVSLWDTRMTYYLWSPSDSRLELFSEGRGSSAVVYYDGTSILYIGLHEPRDRPWWAAWLYSYVPKRTREFGIHRRRVPSGPAALTPGVRQMACVSVGASPCDAATLWLWDVVGDRLVAEVAVNATIDGVAISADGTTIVALVRGRIPPSAPADEGDEPRLVVWAPLAARSTEMALPGTETRRLLAVSSDGARLLIADDSPPAPSTETDFTDPPPLEPGDVWWMRLDDPEADRFLLASGNSPGARFLNGSHVFAVVTDTMSVQCFHEDLEGRVVPCACPPPGIASRPEPWEARPPDWLSEDNDDLGRAAAEYCRFAFDELADTCGLSSFGCLPSDVPQLVAESERWCAAVVADGLLVETSEPTEEDGLAVDLGEPPRWGTGLQDMDWNYVWYRFRSRKDEGLEICVVRSLTFPVVTVGFRRDRNNWFSWYFRPRDTPEAAIMDSLSVIARTFEHRLIPFDSPMLDAPVRDDLSENFGPTTIRNYLFSNWYH